MEDSPSPVYGAALLMRFGSDPIRGSNPRSSAEPCLLAFGRLPPSLYLPGGTTPRSPVMRAGARKPVVVAVCARKPLVVAMVWGAGVYGVRRMTAPM